jgi:alkylation response protein AidB-like acyl-CoA dehydrogenase
MSLAELTPEQREIRELAARVADERVAPHAAAWDREHTFPRELFGELGELGLMGVCVPEEHGGAGADFLSYVLVLEELARADAGVGVTVAVHTSACTLPLLAHGSPEQVERLVPALAAGEEIGAFALTEPGAGSDAGAMRTRFAGGGITGTKQWCTNGSHASTFLVFAREGERASAFVVRAGAQGFEVGREAEKLGLNSSSTADLAFEATPAERLGEPGGGMRIALATLDGGRIGIAAQAVGIAQAALELATGYAKERQAFGGPIARCRRSSTSSPTCRPRSRRRARWSGARRGSSRPGTRTPSRERRRSCSPRPSRAARRARRSRCSAATATRRSSRPSAITATPR